MAELDTAAIRRRFFGSSDSAVIRDLCDALDAARAALALTATRLASARAELARWEGEYPCDGLCTDAPEEDCSRHGRPPAEVWAIVLDVQAQRDALAAAIDGPFGAHEFTGPVEYRLSWEMASALEADQAAQRYGRDLSKVGWADDWFTEWRTVTKVTTDPWDQFHTLKRWADTREQPIRNVVLEQRRGPRPDDGWAVVNP